MTEEEEVFLTPEEQLIKYSDRIISSVIKHDKVSDFNRQLLFGQLDPSYFRDEGHIVYKLLYKFKEDGVIPDTEFLELYLLRNEKVILESTDNIDISSFADIDENPVVGYASAVLKYFVRLLQEDIEPNDGFSLLIEKYKLEYQAIRLNDVVNQTKVILHDGITKGKKVVQGVQDAMGYAKGEFAKIEAMSDKTAGTGFSDASVVGMTDDDELDPIKIGDFGNIEELNKHFGGIFTPNFYSFIAPTKGGKSKICTSLVHNITVINGNNMAVWAKEGGNKAFLAQLRATHFNYYYNRNAKPQDVIRGIDQKTILYKTFGSPKLRELEAVSRADLFSNPNYGKIQLIDRPFYGETFISEIETAVQLSGAKAVFIDYLQLISSNCDKGKSETIGKAYQDLLGYCKARNIACIVPAQYKQDFMEQLAKTKDFTNVEVRTGGGESAEIIRTPDINIAMYASAEDLIQRRMKLLSVPSRMASPFMPFDIYADLGYCYFSSMVTTEQG